MEKKVETTNSEEFKSSMVSKFVEDLRNGQSVLQQPKKEPSYVKNVASGKILKDINAIIVAQGLKDNGKAANLVVTAKQKDDKRYINVANKEAIATAMFDDSRAYYQKNDKEVVEGKARIGEHKKDADGKLVPDTQYSMIYAAEDLYESKFQKAKDENGNFIKYEKDIPYTDKDGKELRYEKDGSYQNFSGETVSYKAGDIKIKHKAGSYVGDYIATDKRVAQPEPSHLPQLLDSKDLAPLYQRKNDSGREVLMEGLTKAFRGMMQGDFEGWKPTAKEIDAIEKDLISHPREFRGIANSAWTRAEGDKNTVAKMDKAIQEREQKQQNTKENVNQNQKSKGRS